MGIDMCAARIPHEIQTSTRTPRQDKTIPITIRNPSLNPPSTLRRQSHLALTPMNIYPILATVESLKLRRLWNYELAKYEIAELL